MINNSQSHANVVSSHGIFRIDHAGEEINAPFFDIEDDYHVKNDLWLTSKIALEMMSLLYEINQGRNVIKFIPQFSEFLSYLDQDTTALWVEIQGAERFQNAMAIRKAMEEGG